VWSSFESREVVCSRLDRQECLGSEVEYATLLRDHVTPKRCSIDRSFLRAYVPQALMLQPEHFS
jgi:hypothetical protein